MLNRAERKSIKARARWKAYRIRRALHHNVKTRWRIVPVTPSNLKMWARDGHPQQLAPKSRKRI